MDLKNVVGQEPDLVIETVNNDLSSRVNHIRQNSNGSFVGHAIRNSRAFG